MIERILMDFWYKFDDYFQYHASQETKKNIKTIRVKFKLYQRFRRHFLDNTINTTFIQELENNPEVIESLKRLAFDQLTIINHELKCDPQLEQSAFEYFGMGILFDDVVDEQGNYRRSPLNKIHLMDENIYGYFSWHSFVRSISILLYDNTERWLQLDRFIALSAAIYSKQKPKQSTADGNKPDPMNKRIDLVSLQNLRNIYLKLNFEEIDNKFFNMEI
jgi:hypothetical protein